MFTIRLIIYLFIYGRVVWGAEFVGALGCNNVAATCNHDVLCGAKHVVTVSAKFALGLPSCCVPHA